jgi:predicted membrane-bound dolichyl-phosphate-mannose-protein mannosyltransferase
MRKAALAVLFAALVVTLTLTAYAAAKSYQFTGTVKTVSGNAFTVQKSATEIWDFATDASTKGTPKVGDKVTVYYKMIATEIEAKPATAAPPVKKK